MWVEWLSVVGMSWGIPEGKSPPTNGGTPGTDRSAGKMRGARVPGGWVGYGTDGRGLGASFARVRGGWSGS